MSMFASSAAFWLEVCLDASLFAEQLRQRYHRLPLGEGEELNAGRAALETNSIEAWGRFIGEGGGFRELAKLSGRPAEIRAELAALPYVHPRVVPLIAELQSLEGADIAIDCALRGGACT